jgi:RNA-directed DNA polymerase
MKRYGNLYEKIIDLENLRLADEKARKGKMRSWGVSVHDKNRDANIFAIHSILARDSYQTSPYRIFKIVTDAGKEREIYQLPYYPDRIMHHAIMNIMEPIWTSVLTADTYSCIKGRGIHGVVRKMKTVLKDFSGTKYCLKLDVRKFYPSINHDILKQLLRKKIKDVRLLALLDEIIDSAPGVPIGNYLSQFFANIYIAYFDHWIKEVRKEQYYFRYADDIVVLHSDKSHLHSLLADIKSYMTDNLDIDVKDNWQVFPVDSRGIDFVGYVFRHTHVRLRKSIKTAWARKTGRIKKRDMSRKDMAQSLSCYAGWAKHCDGVNLSRALAV